MINNVKINYVSLCQVKKNYLLKFKTINFHCRISIFLFKNYIKIYKIKYSDCMINLKEINYIYLNNYFTQLTIVLL